VRLTDRILWVCTRCMLAREHGTQENCCDGWWHDACTCPEPWNLEPTTDVAAGLLWEEHSCGRDESNWHNTECNCDTREHVTAECDACGDPSHGKRHAYTVMGA